MIDDLKIVSCRNKVLNKFWEDVAEEFPEIDMIREDYPPVQEGSLAQIMLESIRLWVRLNEPDDTDLI